MSFSAEPTTNVRCSIVIPTWQRVSALRETLDSLAHQTCSDFEAIVVSDGDDPATHGFADEFTAPFPLRWVFHPQNLGQAAARNTGAKAGEGDIVLFLDDDTLAHQDLVSRHLGHFQQLGPCCRIAVCGKIQEDRRAALPCWTDKFLQQSWEQTLDHVQSRIAGTEAASVGEEFERWICFGLNCSIRRDVFLRSDGFRPELRYSGEDMEYGHRLYRSGVQFVGDPLAIVRHRNTKPMTEYFRRAWYIGGQVDVKRVFELGQRNPQTQQLPSMHCGYANSKVVARSFWHSAPAMRGVASLLERATNSTGWRPLFGAWARVCRRAEYWSAVQAEGCTSEMLRQVAGQPVCALALHSISEPQSREERSYYLSPGRFQRYIHWMKTVGYESVSMAEWGENNADRKRILLTFDDGYDDLYSELLPATIEFRLKPLVFLVSDRTGATNDWDHTRGLRRRQLLTLGQIREMQNYGVEFGSHTVTHPWLPSVSDDALRREVAVSKRSLEDMLGKPVTTFAYPFGGVDQRVRAAVAHAGYEFGFTIQPGLNWWGDPLCLNRAEISECDMFLDFALKLRTGYGVRSWAGNHVRKLETGLPTQRLRAAVRRVHDTARQVEAKLRQSR
jgi:peptidoglycan/xylan/chitin deacetylase (PgdA/CDA1 family)/glycosyltransferase involved in cell wall biosynthesis